MRIFFCDTAGPPPPDGPPPPPSGSVQYRLGALADRSVSALASAEFCNPAALPPPSRPPPPPPELQHYYYSTTVLQPYCVTQVSAMSFDFISRVREGKKIVLGNWDSRRAGATWCCCGGVVDIARLCYSSSNSSRAEIYGQQLLMIKYYMQVSCCGKVLPWWKKFMNNSRTWISSSRLQRAIQLLRIDSRKRG